MTPSCARRRSSDRRSRGARGGSGRRPRQGRSSPSPSGCPTDGRRSPAGSSRSSVCSLPGRLAAEGVARVLGPVHVALAVVDLDHGDAALDRADVHAEIAADAFGVDHLVALRRSEEHTSELQSLMRISYAVFCLKKKTNTIITL